MKLIVIITFQLILKKINCLFLILLLGLCITCTPDLKDSTHYNTYPQISPDYEDICIPYNIAPLNFSSEGEKMSVELKSKNGSLMVQGTGKVFFPIGKFKELLKNNIGDTIWVIVNSYINDRWNTYKPFFWKVVPDPVDSFLTYRLIEPGYEVWNKVCLAQRNITNYDEIHIADNNLTGSSCINCHIPNKYRNSQSFFHIRGPKGMTVIADGKKLYGINTKLKGAYSSMIYGNWHPSGQYIVFSTNIVLPALHSIHDKRAFVYDTISDVVVLNLRKKEILKCPLLTQKDVFETFPEFSSDGTKLFYCSAKKIPLPEEYDKLQYSICSIDFDSTTGVFGTSVDTLFNGPEMHKTVSELKASPDGKYLAFDCFSYGTFPLWHNDARIYLYDLKTAQIDTLPELNNNKDYANSYHSWSTNSRWLAFASKRDNGLYSKIYFSYIDKNGKAHKPFVLPQKDPEFYDFFLKSYNVPELIRAAVPFTALDIEKMYDEGKIETLYPQK